MSKSKKKSPKQPKRIYPFWVGEKDTGQYYEGAEAKQAIRQFGKEIRGFVCKKCGRLYGEHTRLICPSRLSGRSKP